MLSVSPLFISFTICFHFILLFLFIFFFSNSALLNIVHQIFNFSSIFKRFSLQLIPQYVKCWLLMYSVCFLLKFYRYSIIFKENMFFRHVCSPCFFPWYFPPWFLAGFFSRSFLRHLFPPWFLAKFCPPILCRLFFWAFSQTSFFISSSSMFVFPSSYLLCYSFKVLLFNPLNHFNPSFTFA